MTVVVEIADQRRFAAGVEHALFDFGHSGSGFRHVYGDAHHLGTGGAQIDALARGAFDVGGVGVGHRLDDDGRASAHLDAANLYAERSLPMRSHDFLPKETTDLERCKFTKNARRTGPPRWFFCKCSFQGSLSLINLEVFI